MTIDIGAVLEDGIAELLKRKAAVLLGLFVVVGVVGSIGGDSLGFAIIDAMVDAVRETQGQVPAEFETTVTNQRENLTWGLDVGFGTALLLFIAGFLVGELARIPAVRALADRDADTLDRSHYATNLLSIFLNRVLVAIVVFVLLAVTAVVVILVPAFIFPPLALLGLVPFLYVAIGLYFASYAVTIDEDDALSGIERSWGYAKNNRLRLVVIAVIVGIATILIGIPTGLLLSTEGTAIGLQETLAAAPVGLVVAAVLSAASTVFTIAIAAQTYVHLDRDANGGVGDDGIDGESIDSPPTAADLDGDTEF